MKNFLADGLYENLPIDEYHSDTAIGSSTLKTLARKTPAHVIGSQRKESAAFDFGSALHLAVLEPHKNEKIVCGPEDRRGAKWTSAKADAEVEGKLLLTSGDYSKVMSARDSIFKNVDCAELLSGRVDPEISVFHTNEEFDLRLKIRPDLYNYESDVMIDLKTSQSASPDFFARSISDYGYHIQAAFYEKVWNGYHKTLIGAFLFMVVEKEPPYAIAVYELDHATLLEGYNLVQQGLEKYKECRTKNVWPGYPSGVQKIGIPAYAFKTIPALMPDEPSDPA